MWECFALKVQLKSITGFTPFTHFAVMVVAHGVTIIT